MEYSDPAVVDVAPSPDKPRSPDPSLLAEARIKAEKLRDFVEESVDKGDSRFASYSIIQDYNGLRALVVELLPRLVAILPPEAPIPHSGAKSGSGPEFITYDELLFFCKQIKDFLDKRASGAFLANLDDGSSLFGPDGLKHDPPLLAAARVKAQSLLDFVTQKTEIDLFDRVRVPATVLNDYNQLHALIREAAPELESILPPEIAIPAEPKPRPDEPAPSIASRFFGFLGRDARPKTPKYRELLYYCQQVARLLK